MDQNERIVLEKMILQLAVGAKKWQENISSLPAELHEGHLRLVKIAIEQQVPYPENLRDLLQWLQTPMGEWKISGLTEYFPAEEPMLIPFAGLSDFYEEWLEERVSQEESEQRVMREILQFCRKVSPPLEQAYRDIRMFLIQNPIVDFLTLRTFLLPYDEFLQNKVRECYEEIVLPYPEIYLCPYCRWTLTNRGGDWECTRWVCKHNGDFTHFAKLDMTGDKKYYRLTKGMQKFVQNPGIAELALAGKIKARGWNVVLYPEVDRCDLRISKGDKRLDIDVKDYSHPKLLADYIQEHVQKTDHEKQDDRVIFVVPQHQEQLHPDYVKRVQYYLHHLDVPVMVEKEFLRWLGGQE
ncbi:hypothetical protein BSNK01_07970 [Bacillaceae bacterium]